MTTLSTALGTALGWGSSSGSPTKIRDARRSTFQRRSGFRAGGLTASPVLHRIQAPLVVGRRRLGLEASMATRAEVFRSEVERYRRRSAGDEPFVRWGHLPPL
jgi:hypothetical protein